MESAKSVREIGEDLVSKDLFLIELFWKIANFRSLYPRKYDESYFPKAR